MASTPSDTFLIASTTSSLDMAAMALPVLVNPPRTVTLCFSPKSAPSPGFHPMRIRPTSPPCPSRTELVANVVEIPTRLMSEGFMSQDAKTASTELYRPIERS